MKRQLPRLIGLSGLAVTGKDTLADHLVAEYGYVKMASADPIKRLLNDRFGWTMEQWNDRDWKERNRIFQLFSTREGIDSRGWSPRELAQWLGTEVGRTIGGEDVWIQKLWNDYCMSATQKPLVVTDVRFDNEAKFIGDRGGIVLRILRGDAQPVAAHKSEAGVTWNLVDATVYNDSDVAHYLEDAVNILEKFG